MEILALVGVIIAFLTLIYKIFFGGNSLPSWIKSRKKKYQNKESILFFKYLKTVITEHEFIDFRGIEEEVSSKLAVRLNQIYIPPMAKANDFVISTFRNPITGVLEVEKEKSNPLGDLLKKQRLSVILGGAGGGKTSFFKYITLKFAINILNENSISFLARFLRKRREVYPVPLYIPLREAAILLRKHGITFSIDEILSSYYSELLGEEIPPIFFSSIFKDKDSILLFDGLDEIGDFELRCVVVDKIQHFLKLNKRVNCWLSCRQTAYYGPARLGADFTIFELQPFNKKQIGEFINRWYLEVESYLTGYALSNTELIVRKAIKLADNLIVSLAKSETLQVLASNPLILTAIAIVHYSKMVLPERRAELFETCVQALLGSWDIAKTGSESKSITWASTVSSMSIKAKRTQLEYIALSMCESRVSSLPSNEAINILASISPKYRDEKNSVEQAQDFIDAVTQRGGLFIEYEKEHCRFVHLSFQQYLAARRIARFDNYIEFIQDRIGDAWWDEIIKLAISYQSARDPEKAYSILESILEQNRLPPEYRLLIVSEALVECDLTTLPLKLNRKIIPELQINMTKKEITPNIRFRLGILLGQLGDSRNFDIMIKIPGGNYIIGDDECEYKEKINISSFQIAKYPVTNCQFENFIKDSGYSKKDFWCEEGWHWSQSNNIRYPFYWQDARYNAPNQPVVGVNWFEAKAYASWSGMRLPTEMEWEAAARGLEGLVWPWGNEFALLCNCNEMGINTPCPVGVFSEGASVFGVMDMIGNVWEWTDSIYEGFKISLNSNSAQLPEAARVLRGGSWFEGYLECKVCARRWLHPGAREFNFGFRLAK